MHTSYPPSEHPRSRYMRVRLSEPEWDRLCAVAATQGRSVSEVVRLSLPLGRPAPATRRSPFPGGGPVIVTHEGSD
jgi:hypothetical protein